MDSQIDKTKKDLEKIMKKVRENLAVVLLLLIIFDLIIAVIFFAKYYVFLSPEVSSLYVPLGINKPLLNRFVQRYGEREKDFNEIWDKSYRDLFRGGEWLTE
jgi:hypothetical protein